MQHDIAKKTMESKKAHKEPLRLRSRTRRNQPSVKGAQLYSYNRDKCKSYKKSALKDFAAFARRMCLQFTFHSRDKKPHPFTSEETFEDNIKQFK